MNRILDMPLNFIFDKALLLKKFEVGMNMRKGIFNEVPVWLRFPGLSLQLWTLTILSRIASKLEKPLLAENATIQRTRLGAPRILVELHQTKEVISQVKIRVCDQIILQKVEYDRFPKPCEVCDKWGHITQDCDPEKRNRKWQSKEKASE